MYQLPNKVNLRFFYWNMTSVACNWNDHTDAPWTNNFTSGFVRAFKKAIPLKHSDICLFENCCFWFSWLARCPLNFHVFVSLLHVFTAIIKLSQYLGKPIMQLHFPTSIDKEYEERTHDYKQFSWYSTLYQASSTEIVPYRQQIQLSWFDWQHRIDERLNKGICFRHIFIVCSYVVLIHHCPGSGEEFALTN